MEFNSIKDFKRNFTQIYHGSIKEKLNSFEHEKSQTKKTIAIINTLVLIVIGIILFLAVKDTPKMSQDALTMYAVFGITAIALCFVIKMSFKKRFENKIKIAIMPEVMKAFGNFTWTTTPVVSPYDIKNSTLYERFEDKQDDDNFHGIYNGLEVNIDETELTYTTRDSKGNRERHTEFKGIIVCVNMKKDFKGHTVIKLRHLLNSSRYEEIKLEDPEISKKYYISGTDQIESRYLLTTSFIERFKNIQKTFKADYVEASFIDSNMMLALRTNKDLFSLGDLDRPTDDTKQLTELLDEFVSILEIIDELKLNQNIGL